MGAIIIKALEDLKLGTLMDSEKTGEIVSREEIFKKLKEKWILSMIPRQTDTYGLNSISLFINKTKQSFAKTYQNEWICERSFRV